VWWLALWAKLRPQPPNILGGCGCGLLISLAVVCVVAVDYALVAVAVAVDRGKLDHALWLWWLDLVAWLSSVACSVWQQESHRA
jgi:hypothetical protein